MKSLQRAQTESLNHCHMGSSIEKAAENEYNDPSEIESAFQVNGALGKLTNSTTIDDQNNIFTDVSVLVSPRV